MPEKEYVEKPKAEGTWKSENGERNIKFTKVFASHEFSEEEIEKLLNGESITIEGLIDKNGNEYGVEGRLEEQEYKDIKYVGFKAERFIRTIPKKLFGKTLTAEEYEALNNGEWVDLEDCVSKKGNVFNCTVRWNFNEEKIEFKDNE